jgi:nicotinamide-nucleotide amidase
MGAADGTGLEETVGRLLTERGLTLAVSESCTGGLVGHRITNVPGSSNYYLGSVTAYSSQAKVALLGVAESTLAAHGAVSEQTALEMARGVRRAFGADIGLSATGIAGPGGGTSEKRVGLVYLALAAPNGEFVERHEFEGDRLSNKERSAEALLALLAKHLEERS